MIKALLFDLGGTLHTVRHTQGSRLLFCAHLLKILEARKPKSMKLVTLLDKPSRRVCDVHVDYTGFEVEDKFVIGFGLDFAQKYRNLPYIGVVDEIGDE